MYKTQNITGHQKCEFSKKAHCTSSSGKLRILGSMDNSEEAEALGMYFKKKHPIPGAYIYFHESRNNVKVQLHSNHYALMIGR